MERNQTVASLDTGVMENRPTWAGDVLIPLVQNLFGGAAIAGLGMIAVRVFAHELTPDAALGCALAGATVACLITVTRFFGDDWALARALRESGKRSRDHEFDILNKELFSARAALEAAGQPTSGFVMSKRVMIGQVAVRNARTLAQIAYSGGNYRRRAMRDKMGEKDHSRAMRMLIVGNVLDRATGNLRREDVPTVNEAMKIIERIEKNDVPNLTNDAWVPGWW